MKWNLNNYFEKSIVYSKILIIFANKNADDRYEQTDY
jgi:hypothetical protein